MVKTATKPCLQLALPGTRVGRMGMLELGPDYMAGVKRRVERMKKEIRFEPTDKQPQRKDEK